MPILEPLLGAAANQKGIHLQVEALGWGWNSECSPAWFSLCGYLIRQAEDPDTPGQTTWTGLGQILSKGVGAEPQAVISLPAESHGECGVWPRHPQHVAVDG